MVGLVEKVHVFGVGHLVSNFQIREVLFEIIGEKNDFLFVKIVSAFKLVRDVKVDDDFRENSFLLG